MNINYNLETKLSQKITLTKELKQSLDILQMTTQDIEVMANEKIRENPILEIESKREVDWEKYHEHMRNSNLKISNNFYEENYEDNNIESYIPKALRLIEHLEEEISMLKLTKEQIKIAKFLITLIDDNGYIKADLIECAKKINVEFDFLEKVLLIIQNIEPAGICARNIEECLMIQLKDREYNDKILFRIVKEDLSNVGRHKYKEIIKKYNISDIQLKKYIEIIKTLDPKPGRAFSVFTPVYILPDILVEKYDNQLIIKSNKEANIKININKTYEQMLIDEIDSETKEYLKDKMNAALNLIRSIEQRKSTILKVATAIVDEQKEFFIKGKEYLKPLKMKDIAKVTGFHESTISRTVNGKYMLTPSGIYEFKFFFSNKIIDKSGENLSNKAVKNKIKVIVQNEDKKKPYSDKKICDLLLEDDIDISRRTVSKYREELKIPSSAERKEI
ncbi:MAG: RNA polymerase factor sigma-54 [Filifactoraceae bacterium]